MKVYMPTPITSTEQAESLPIGTMAQTYSVVHDNEVCVKDWDNAWLGTHGTGAFTDLGMVGFTALVPVEAEEETSVVVRNTGLQDAATHPFAEANMDGDGNVWLDNGLERVDVTDKFNEWAKQNMRTRYVTPWEPVAGPPSRG